MVMTPFRLAVAAALLAGPLPVRAEVVLPDVLQCHDYSLADTPNERTALAYLYTAWNDGQLGFARRTYWVKEARFADPNGPPPAVLPAPPRYTIKKVISEGNNVVVLAFVEGFGIGQPAMTQRGPSKEPKIGDAVVEIFEFAPSGLIARKWDTIEPLTESTYDFR